MSDFYQPVLNASPTDVEIRAGVPSLEQLHAQQREIVRRFSDLDLLFGDKKSTWKEKRKAHRDLIASLIEGELQEEAKKNGVDWKPVAESTLERKANGDQRHIQFVAEVEQGYAQWLKLSTQLGEIEDLINDRKATMYFVGREIGLT